MRIVRTIIALACAAGLGAAPRPAAAVPSFAAQTGQPCTACHVGALIQATCNGVNAAAPDRGASTFALANLKLGPQYTACAEFDGAVANFDGAGRNARNNNTLFLFLWTIF